MVVMGVIRRFIEFQDNYEGQPLIDWVREHAEIPIFTVTVYLWIVFYASPMMKGRPQSPTYKRILSSLFAGWNLLLAVFSIIGASITVPHLAKTIYEKGFIYSICSDPENWTINGAPGLWLAMFILSKIPELLDTVFLVLQDKKVIFLHWFHHCTVMLYCWHAFHHRIAPGLWFATMNYAVHSVMYTYYFAMAAKLQWLAVPFAPLITTVQILQMAAGSYITFKSASIHWSQGQDACKCDAANYKLGLAMYGSYFILFCSLFLNKYFGPEKSSPTSSKKPTKASGVDSPPAGPPLHEGAAKSATGSKANGSQNGGSRSGNSNGVEKENICGVEMPSDMAGRFSDFSETPAKGLKSE